MSGDLKDKEEALFRKLWDVLQSEGEKEENLQDAEVRKAIRQIYRVTKMPEGDYSFLWNDIKGNMQKQQPEKRRSWHRLLRYAAVIVFPLLCAGIAWYLWQPEEKKTTQSLATYIRPQRGIMLTLADGRTLDLREQKSGEILQSGTIEIHKDSLQGITYEMRAQGQHAVAFHTLEIPVAADYRLRLSDGTIVYLNSESKLKYPEVFSGEERKVYLEGEGYFEVAKDAKHPFRVMVNDMEVEVLGTHFNVNAYPEQKGVTTTLAEGKVRVRDRGREVVLEPGQQAIATSGQLEVREVDVKEYLSWKDGLFIFRRMPLAEIMVQVYRWYGIKSVFSDEELRELTFSGVINKNLSAEDLFRVIGKVVDVRFTMEEDDRVRITTK